MGCKLCGRNSCTESFHTLKEQDEFENKTGRYAPEPDPDLERKATLADDLAAALRELMELILTPQNEYALTRVDGEPAGLADQMVIGKKYAEAEAALVKYKAATGRVVDPQITPQGEKLMGKLFTENR